MRVRQRGLLLLAPVVAAITALGACSNSSGGGGGGSAAADRRLREVPGLRRPRRHQGDHVRVDHQPRVGLAAEVVGRVQPSAPASRSRTRAPTTSRRSCRCASPVATRRTSRSSRSPVCCRRWSAPARWPSPRRRHVANVDKYWNKAWKAYGTVNGTFYAAPMSANMKSLVWYSPKAFTAAGYKVPTTWDEMMTLSATRSPPPARSRGAVASARVRRPAGRPPTGSSRSCCASPAATSTTSGSATPSSSTRPRSSAR